MDIDNDLDGRLLQQFSSMGTTDRDVLISEFQKLLGNALSPSGCEFYLDMTNWNLQQAIGAYYDLHQPTYNLPTMSFVKDVTIGEGESVSPNTKFIKTWRIQNTGTENWPPGCCLKFCSGENLSLVERVMVEALLPGQCADVSVEMTSPSSTGVYHGQWRMSTPTGLYFGEVIWAIITVDEGGILGVTQQLSRIGGGYIHNTPSQPTNPTNPFGGRESVPGAPVYNPTPNSQPGSPTLTSTPVNASSPEALSRWLHQTSVKDSHHHGDHTEDVEMS